MIHLIRTALWRWEKRRWHVQFCRAQARAASDAELRWYASGHGLVCPVGRAAFRREARHRRIATQP